jgi:glycosyltransferase involved in cell wall biosynthesis
MIDLTKKEEALKSEVVDINDSETNQKKKTQRVKVLITGPDLNDPGGVSNYYSTILPLLCKKSNLSIIYIPIGRTYAKGKGRYLFKDQIRVRDAIKVNKTSVVLINPSLNFKSFFRDMFFIRTALISGNKVVVFFRGWEWPFARFVEKYLKTILLLYYGKSSKIIVLSTEFAEQLQRCGVKVPIELETTTVPLEYIINKSEMPGILETRRKSPRKILFMSRLIKEKGAYETIDALKLLLDNGYDVQLTIAGEGPEAENIQKNIVSLGLQEQVLMAGYLRGKDKIKALYEHSIFCFPTRYGEGMPNAILEAMGAGLAIVTTAVGGVKDFFEEGKMGALVSSDVSDIKNGLEQVLDDDHKLETIGRYNSEFARKNFSSDVVTDRLEKTILDVDLEN